MKLKSKQIADASHTNNWDFVVNFQNLPKRC